MEFEWNQTKNLNNQEKHGVDFDDAKQVFSDPNRICAEDNRQNYGESRWITIGKATNLLLTVVYTLRDTIRIISARRANRKEREEYHNAPNRT